ncbi:MAG: H-type lectin domain-containing protein [Pseudomonadota bacterium]
MLKIGGNALGVERGSVLVFSDVEDGGIMWTGEGPRLARRPVEFSQPFLAPPVVLVTLEMWDIDQTSNQRADITADEIAVDRFDVVFKTWGDTRVARVRVGWLAIGQLADPDIWKL